MMFDCVNLCGSTSTVTDRGIFALQQPPSVLQESMEMLSGGLTIYVFADLRDLARRGDATVGLEALEPPISASTVLEALKDNKEVMMQSGNYEDLENRISALENIFVHQNNILGNVMGSNTELELVEFEDSNSENEMVHSIVVNDRKKRITVVFRGSVTKKDFITDAKLVQVKVENPVHSQDQDTPETINLHSGFHEYLFKIRKESGKNRITEVMSSVKNLLQRKKGYQLYCTGHSLGGALCTIFGFYAAADKEISQLSSGPIRIFSVASPYCGNIKFLQAFQSLERRGLLQHLRIANAEDVVTLMPFAAPKVGFVSPAIAAFQGAGSLYKHCGIKLHLNATTKKNDYTLTYPQDISSDDNYAKEIERIVADGKNLFNSIKTAVTKDYKAVIKFHSCEEYEARLNSCGVDLKDMTLDKLYRDKSIVGDVLDADYKPPEAMTSAGERFSRIKNSQQLQDSLKGGSEKE